MLEISQPHSSRSDLGHFAGRNALHVHLGQGQFQGPFATFAPFERRGIELDAACLGHLQLQFAEAAGDRLGLEAIGIATSRVSRAGRERRRGRRRVRASWLR